MSLLTFTAAAVDDRPNILFILTDDQDAHMSTLDYMPNVQRHIVEKGAKFERHYCTGRTVLYGKTCDVC
jgi:arylsulfatase A-like enzyme